MYLSYGYSSKSRDILEKSIKNVETYDTRYHKLLLHTTYTCLGEKAIDLAKKMIQLSGLEIGKDIEIKVTGLRPGEKLYEELLASEENTIPTHNPQILIAKTKENSEDQLKVIEDLIQLFDNQQNEQIVRKMKDIVPEYISNNSEFEKLDNK
jgi:FlaA1/EpsC-like NDP-sugar epimerase